jgi:hypothetical protein
VTKSFKEILQEELKKEDQFFRTPPSISNYIREQVCRVGTKQAYFSQIFSNLATYGFTIQEPCTKEVIATIRTHLDLKEAQNGNTPTKQSKS